MGNPRRDAFEYGVLITLGTSMAAAYAFLLSYSNQRNPDGSRRRLPRVDLDEEVDLGKAWEDMKKVVGEMRWGSDPTTTTTPTTTTVLPPGSKNDDGGVVGGGGGAEGGESAGLNAGKK